MKKSKYFTTKNIVLMGLLCAMAYLSVFIVRIPMVSFLSYEPKDVIITLGALILGPIATMLISFVVSLVEMVTISDTGPIGLLMNIISTVAFALPVALIYRHKKNLKNALHGLFIGVVLMTVSMILWNYIVTPLYLGVSREAVKAMLIPVFLPFNILKGVINSTLVFLLYKPLVGALRHASIIPRSDENLNEGKGTAIVFNILSVVILAACIVIWIIWRINQ